MCGIRCSGSDFTIEGFILESGKGIEQYRKAADGLCQCGLKKKKHACEGKLSPRIDTRGTQIQAGFFTSLMERLRRWRSAAFHPICPDAACYYLILLIYLLSGGVKQQDLTGFNLFSFTFSRNCFYLLHINHPGAQEDTQPEEVIKRCTPHGKCHWCKKNRIVWSYTSLSDFLFIRQSAGAGSEGILSKGLCFLDCWQKLKIK